MNLNPLKDWLYFTRLQRRGIVVFALVILMVPLVSGLVKNRLRMQPVDMDAFMMAVLELEERMSSAGEAARDGHIPEQERPGMRETGVPVELRPFPFDPNAMTQALWDSMGLPPRIGRSIQNFVAAGGGFRYREDLRRIYLLEDWMYEALEDYVVLPPRPERPVRSETASGAPPGSAASEHRADAGISAETPLAKTAGRISEIARNAPVDINKADTSDLQTIRGIGPAFSRRIVGYRELLGGFLFKEQLKEVYGLDSLRYEEIKDFVVAGETEIRKININTADFSDLVRHPYIDRNIANAILNLRRQHGDFASANDLSMSYVINEEQLARMLPYICTGD